MSNTTWHRVEDGAPVRDTTYSRIDQVLDWPPGTCAAILAGEEAGPERTESAAGGRISRPELTAEALRRAVTDATIGTMPGATGAEIAALAERAVEEARRLGLLPDGP